MKQSKWKFSGVVLAALLAAAPIASTGTIVFADANSDQTSSSINTKVADPDDSQTIINFMNNLSGSPLNFTTAQLSETFGTDGQTFFNRGGNTVGTNSNNPDGSKVGLVNPDGTINGLASYFYNNGADAKTTASDMWVIAYKYNLKSEVSLNNGTPIAVTSENANSDQLKDLWTNLSQNGGDLKETLTLQDKSDDSEVASKTLTVNVTKPQAATTPASSSNIQAPSYPVTIASSDTAYGVVTIKDDQDVAVYNHDGNKVEGTILPASSAWRTIAKVTFTDGRVMYKVATNEYVLADAVDFAPSNIQVTSDSGVFTVANTSSGYLTLQKLTQANTFEEVPARLLPQGTQWRVDQKAVWNGQTYYRVATNEWVLATGGSVTK
ncbi:SLAP domain-containing protein [Bombilactobacillus folatiphilus]|uniref:SLAP domain-containing protein n=1 Tax=Bombilactobacillus folatiphilus TaxID=2923362 RepID=A0ABY4P8D1_9LACO|nr:SLAP domain-containing protein [Bombilactobacillus folatiphilus]UQS81949.1 SLAP domain-containing protein [Bombilactobacillus folatiphilus]